jgi:hypothetical protein
MHSISRDLAFCRVEAEGPPRVTLGEPLDKSIEWKTSRFVSELHAPDGLKFARCVATSELSHFSEVGTI